MASANQNGDRMRSVCFTLNNYTDEDVARIRELGQSVRYGVFQREVAPGTGTKHLQGYLYSDSAKAFSRWKSLIGDRAHIEKARGTPEQASNYCKKEESREPDTEFEEFGDLPSQGKRSDLEAISTAIASGATIEEVAAQHPGDFIRYHRGIETLHAVFQTPRNHKTRIYWLFGPTGTGKSAWAHSRFPGAYWKMGSSKWWDGYYGEPHVIIDDYRRDLCTFAELLRLFDRYPMRVERKGSSCQFRATDLVITTPDDPRRTWEGRTEEQLGQLLRRIEEIWEFPGVGLPPINRTGSIGTAPGPHVATFNGSAQSEVGTVNFSMLEGIDEEEEYLLAHERDEVDDEFWVSQGADSLLGKRK